MSGSSRVGLRGESTLASVAWNDARDMDTCSFGSDFSGPPSWLSRWY